MQQYNKIVAAGYKKSGHQNGIRFRGHFHRAQKKGALRLPLYYRVTPNSANFARAAARAASALSALSR